MCGIVPATNDSLRQTVSIFVTLFRCYCAVGVVLVLLNTDFLRRAVAAPVLLFPLSRHVANWRRIAKF